MGSSYPRPSRPPLTWRDVPSSFDGPRRTQHAPDGAAALAPARGMPTPAAIAPKRTAGTTPAQCSATAVIAGWPCGAGARATPLRRGPAGRPTRGRGAMADDFVVV